MSPLPLPPLCGDQQFAPCICESVSVWLCGGAGGGGRVGTGGGEGISGKDAVEQSDAAARAITAASVPGQAASGPCGKVSNG